MPKRDAVQEVRQEVSRLRKEGFSFSKIARQLAISKSYAVKLANAQDEPAPWEKAAPPLRSLSGNGALQPGSSQARTSARRRLRQGLRPVAPMRLRIAR